MPTISPNGNPLPPSLICFPVIPLNIAILLLIEGEVPITSPLPPPVALRTPPPSILNPLPTLTPPSVPALAVGNEYELAVVK